jgi:hypothetical protein
VGSRTEGTTASGPWRREGGGRGAGGTELGERRKRRPTHRKETWVALGVEVVRTRARSHGEEGASGGRRGGEQREADASDSGRKRARRSGRGRDEEMVFGERT